MKDKYSQKPFKKNASKTFFNVFLLTRFRNYNLLKIIKLEESH